MSRLSVNNINFSYGAEPVLKDISIRLEEGELVSLLGVSGSGKTTLFNIIAGLLKPDSGNVILDGRDISGQSGNISYMLQKDMLLPYMTVEDNVALPLLLKKKPKAEARKFVSGYFEEFGLEGTQKKYPAQLSGGMRQRAALLRTYMFSSDTALLDEPFSALDAMTKHQMHIWYMNIMKKLKMSVFFITHDIDEAILLSDRIYLLTGKPGMVRSEINIERSAGEGFELTNDFLKYKKQITDILFERGRLA